MLWSIGMLWASPNLAYSSSIMKIVNEKVPASHDPSAAHVGPGFKTAANWIPHLTEMMQFTRFT